MNGGLLHWALFVVSQAADPVASGSSNSPAQIESVWDFVIKGGPVMIPIGLCSLVALTVIVERLISLRRKKILPPSFLPDLKTVLKDAVGDKSKALEYCNRHPGPLSNMLRAGIKKLGEPVELVRRHIEEAGAREVVRLRKFLRGLSVIASVAPLLGLLGTIFGMITAFQTVAASAEALGRTELLAKGIYEAMITTAAGLLVAIPTVLAYHAISAKVERLVFEMDAQAIEFVEDYAPSSWLAAPVRETLRPHTAIEKDDGDGRSTPVLAAV